MEFANIGLVIGFLLVGGILLTFGFQLQSSSQLAGWILVAIGFGSFIAGIVSAKSAFG
jgi:hypothetical protein